MLEHNVPFNTRLFYLCHILYSVVSAAIHRMWSNA